MDLTQYILAGFDHLPKKTISLSGVEIPALFNQSSHRDNKTLGGYEPDNESVLYIETSLLTNPRSLKGQLITMDGEQWRIISIRAGDIITYFTIISPDRL